MLAKRTLSEGPARTGSDTPHRKGTSRGLFKTPPIRSCLLLMSPVHRNSTHLFSFFVLSFICRRQPLRKTKSKQTLYGADSTSRIVSKPFHRKPCRTKVPPLLSHLFLPATVHHRNISIAPLPSVTRDVFAESRRCQGNHGTTFFANCSGARVGNGNDGNPRA